MFKVLNMYQLNGMYFKSLKHQKNENFIHTVNGHINHHNRYCKRQAFYAFSL